MTDDRIDSENEAGDRRAEVERARREARSLAERGMAPGRPRGVLSAEDVQARLAVQTAFAESAPSLAVQGTVASRPIKAPLDSVASMRTAQAGFALAIALALVWLWIALKRRGVSK